MNKIDSSSQCSGSSSNLDLWLTLPSNPCSYAKLPSLLFLHVLLTVSSSSLVTVASGGSASTVLCPTTMASCAAETGLVAMDCLVVCCCCPCLVLQVTVFLFVRLPKRVIVKTKRIILRRWHRKRPVASSKGGAGCAASAGLKLEELLDLDDGFEAAFGIGDGADGWKERCFPVVDDDDDGDGVWEAIIEQEGLFWFGSFWGRPEQEGPSDGCGDQMGGSFRLPVGLERVCE